MQYFTAKYIKIVKKTDDSFLLINEVTLDQFLIKTNLKLIIDAFKKGNEIDAYINNPETKEECLFLINKGILIDKEDYSYETYNFQIPNHTYYGLKPINVTEDNVIAFVGIPFGRGNTTDSGTCDFPSTFRAFSKTISLTHPKNFLSHPVGSILNEQKINKLSGLIVADRLRDMGNLFIHPFESNAKAYHKIETKYDSIFKKKIKPFSLGGDHSITYPILKSLNENIDSFNVIHFDAHTDIYSGSFLDINEEFDFFHHGNFVTKCLELKNLKKYVMLGLRGKPSGNLNEKIDFYDVLKIKKILQEPSLFDLGLSGKTYITFDIDILDPMYAQGTATPVEFGLTPFEVINLFEICFKNIEIIGIDFVEVNPARDNKNKSTMNLAMNLILALLSNYD